MKYWYIAFQWKDASKRIDWRPDHDFFIGEHPLDYAFNQAMIDCSQDTQIVFWSEITKEQYDKYTGEITDETETRKEAK